MVCHLCKKQADYCLALHYFMGYLPHMEKFDGLSLFSGGLDSVLASRLLMEQGKKIHGLHFCTPFFGKKDKVAHWQNIYGLSIEAIDVSSEYIEMLKKPVHGYGSVLNPCVDCKILMLRCAKKLMPNYGAKFLISGEVLGQRPMSQRRDTLNVIRRDADVQDILLRPLCALHMTPLSMELSGEIDRTRLRAFSGRGRKDQLALAKEFGITEIPTPAGGCMLTEKENACRYWPLLQRPELFDVEDFHLINFGRQLWHEESWLTIGRNQADNELISATLKPSDYSIKVATFAGPLALLRNTSSSPLMQEILQNAAQLVSTYSPKAVQWAQENNSPLQVRIFHQGEQTELLVEPKRESLFQEPSWDNVRDEIHALRKEQ